MTPCEIQADVVWEILNADGDVIGGTGHEGEPFRTTNNWVFEGCIAAPVDLNAPLDTWRLKERLGGA